MFRRTLSLCIWTVVDTVFWAFGPPQTVTPRIMYDESPNRGWNVVYELGDFWNKNDFLKTQCSEYLNETWWMGLSDDVEEDELVRLGPDRAVGPRAETAYSVATTLAAVVLMVVAVAMIAVLKQCGMALRNRKMDRVLVDHEVEQYGAV